MKPEVRRIIIFRTNLPSSSLSHSIYENNGQNPSSTVYKGIDYKWALIQHKAEDVTSRFVKYPINRCRDKMQICLNGNVITYRFYSMPHERKTYRDLCGKITILSVPNAMNQ